MFCIKCGNKLSEGFKFCPICGEPMKIIQTTAVEKPATVEPRPASATAEAVYAPINKTVKVNTKGINAVCAIIAAVLCGLTLMHYLLGYVITGYYYEDMMYIGRFRAILLLVISILIYASGIVTGIMSKKLAILSVIPFAFLVLKDLITVIGHMAFSGDNIFGLLTFISSLVMFILAAVVKKKVGVVFAGLSIGLFTVLTLYQIVYLFRYLQWLVSSDIRIILKRLIFNSYNIPFFASYIVLSIGLLIRNRKLKVR